MLEGGGKTPILTPLELEEVGYKLVAYPLSLIGVSVRAMQVRFLLLQKKPLACKTIMLYELHVNHHHLGGSKHLSLLLLVTHTLNRR